MEAHTYLTDVSDAEWQILEPLLPSEARTGRPRIHPLRTLINAMLYALRSGCASRLVPVACRLAAVADVTCTREFRTLHKNRRTAVTDES